MKAFGQVQAAKQDPLSFSKMAGGGNDFVVIDNRDRRVGIGREFATEAGELTRRICTRALSVGADGLVLIEPSVRATFRMRYFNSDGGLSDFCANGTRCAARFAFLNVIAPRKMTIETDAGIVGAEVGEGGWVTLALHEPRDFVPERPLEINGRTIRGSSIMVGVPHYVVFLERDLWTQPIEGVGRLIRHHPKLAPHGANANFIVVRDRHAIEIRTYERGVEAETLACGSGVVASVSTGALFGQLDSPVSVRTRSGITFEVSFRREGTELHDLKLRGDARLVFRSQLTPETLDGFDPDFVRDPTPRAAVP